MSADCMLIDIDPSDPYDAMARRMAYSCINGPTEHRVNCALTLAEQTQADGVVLYAHWGCKATLGVSQTIKEGIEAHGVPCLVLDGDGVDRANRSDGQTATRLDAFLEMLQARRQTDAGSAASAGAGAGSAACAGAGAGARAGAGSASVAANPVASANAEEATR